ncbi:MAG: sigma-70 family RNA polymerase sigma factor [Hyphomicrobiales bacterium]|nr:sigma-70 family RNA polymerase sigma factor [Hyphomicrobiales bacterium]
MLGAPGKDRWGDMMRAALAGNAPAYERLLGDLAGALRGTVRALMARAGRGDADVEDIVQEALLAIHLKRGTWDSRKPFAPWLNAIVRYKLIDALRRQNVRLHDRIDDLAETIAAPAEQEAAAGDVERLLARLDARQQRIVRAASIEGRSMTEIATELGMSGGAVRVALHRALKKLALLYQSEPA